MRPLFGRNQRLELQLLFDIGYEGGEYTGLGILPGKVVRFELPSEYKVPHMGWNQGRIVRRAPILADTAEGTYLSLIHISEPTRPY